MTISKENLASARVLVVGDVMLDRYWYGAVDRISPEAPVPVVRVTREEERIGAAANVAYNVVTLGAQSSLLTVVGDDDASHKLEALVAKTGIRPFFGRDAQLSTTVKLRVIGRQQQLIRLDFENTPTSEVLASQTSSFIEAGLGRPAPLCCCPRMSVLEDTTVAPRLHVPVPRPLEVRVTAQREVVVAEWSFALVEGECEAHQVGLLTIDPDLAGTALVYGARRAENDVDQPAVGAPAFGP